MLILFLRIVAYIAAAFTALSATAAPARPLDAYFAGYAFLGDHASIKSSYPYSAALLEERDDQGVPLLEIALGKHVATVRNAGLNIITASLGDYKSGDAISLAFALDRENILLEQQADGLYKILIDLHAQILVFDFSEMKIIGSFPVAIQLRDAVRQKPSRAYLMDAIRNLYLSKKFGANIFESFAKRLAGITVRPSYGNYIKVTKVTLGKTIRTQIPNTGPRAHEDYKTYIAQTVSKYLSLNQNVAVLPYTKGQAIGAKMTARFSDGDVYNLTVPEADYSIEVNMPGFVKAVVAEDDSARAWIYVSFLGIKVGQPDLGKTYLDVQFKHGITKTVPRNLKNVDHWSKYQVAFMGLVNGFTKQISVRSWDWLSERTSTKNVVAQLASLEKIIARCR